MRSGSLTPVRVFWPRASREQVVADLEAGLAALARELPVRRAVLFGSWARGRHTAASDVDVLVVHAGGPRADAYALCRRHLAVARVEPHVYSEDEYAEVADIVEKMVAGGILLRVPPAGEENPLSTP